MGSEKLSTIYGRLAEKDINILHARLVPSQLNGIPRFHYVLTVEYGYLKHSNNKLIWPKIAVEGHTLEDAVQTAEKLVESIREA